MIYVSCGHEHGIGIEVFLKSILLLSKKQRDNIKFIVHRKTLQKNLSFLNIRYQFNDSLLTFGQTKLRIKLFDDYDTTISTHSLNLCLDNITKDDLLFTLPTSKDQLIYEGQVLSGHTEFFRGFYSNQNISMAFSGPNNKILLITDHKPIANVSQLIKKDIIVNKVSAAIRSFTQVKSVTITGLNPHAGEGGLLGTEEENIQEAINSLKEKFQSVQFDGPIPSDTIFAKNPDRPKENLIVFMYHDQGLNYFKERNRFLGSNITLGLPFKRHSVDHGTAFNLYSKNTSNYLGCLYSLKEAIALSEAST